MKKVNIVVPIFNEEDVLPELINRLEKIAAQEKKYDFEYIMVENGSQDNSYRILKEANAKNPSLKVLRLSRNFGCDGAITAGLIYSKGDAVIIMNADLQDPPELIPSFIRKWEEGNDVVYGIIKKRHGENIVRRILSSLFYVVINFLTKGLFPRNVSDFRLISKKVVNAVNSLKETNRFMRGIVIWTGFKQTGVEFERHARFAGRSKAGFSTILKVAFNGIFSFSYFPLRITTVIGAVIAAISFAMIGVFIALFFMYGRTVPGHTSTMVAMFFLFGILFFVLGIIGEYLARIYDEVKDRPNFIVSEEII